MAKNDDLKILTSIGVLIVLVTHIFLILKQTPMSLNEQGVHALINIMAGIMIVGDM
jgi:hypothetical protein